jgi:hypothetical protein
MASENKSNPELKSFWNSESLSIRLGLISGLLGILLAVFNVYGKYSEIKNYPVDQEKKALELKIIKDEASASAPKIEEMYVDLTYELFSKLVVSQDRKQNQFLNYPIVPNEIVDDKVSIRPKALFLPDDPSADEHEQQVTFLVLKNKGKRDAVDVKVILDRLALPSKVQINETAGKSSGVYISQLKAAAKDSSEHVINVPMPIEAGKGILIPLFVTRHPFQSDDKQWDVISNIVYLPKILEISDTLNPSKQSRSIRQMKDPVRLESGVFGRG